MALSTLDAPQFIHFFMLSICAFLLFFQIYIYKYHWNECVCKGENRTTSIKTTVESESHSVVSDSLLSHGYPIHSINSPGQNTGVGSLSLVQGIFPTQELNPGLPHCGQILYQLSQKGSPTILHWIAYPFSRGYSQPRNQTRVSCIAGRFFTNWAIREVRTSQTIFTDHPLCSGQPGSIRTAAITKCMLPVGQFIPRMTNIYQASTVCISQNNNYHY